MLMHRYQQAVDELLAKVRETQTETIIKAGKLIADTVASKHKIWLGSICHSIEQDLLTRGGGPLFYRPFSYNSAQPAGTDADTSADESVDPGVRAARNALINGGVKPGDLLVLSSVSGRTRHVVDLAWEAMQQGVTVIAFTSMSYAKEVDPVHPSGKKLYEFVTMAVDNCAPAAEAMLEVEGIEARFAAASGIASDYIMGNITSCAVEELLSRGITPGIYKSANYPGGADYNNNILTPNYEKNGW